MTKRLFAIVLFLVALAAVPASARVTWYYGEQPTSTNLLTQERQQRLAMGALTQALIGSGYSNLAVAPASGLNVTVGPITASGQGDVFVNGVDDASVWGGGPLNPSAGLAPDATTMMQQGLIPSPLTVGPLSVPGTTGQSQISLIECTLTPVDTSAQPQNFISSLGSLQTYVVNRDRVDNAVCTAKSGAAAATPSAPSVDANYVGVANITVPFGATSITATMISMLPVAPLVGAVPVANTRTTFNAASYVQPADGSDFGPALTRAIAAACPTHGEVFVPPGQYTVNETVAVNCNVSIAGANTGFNSQGAVITDSGNFALFNVPNTFSPEFHDLSLIGSTNAAFTAQDLIFVASGSSEVVMEAMSFQGGYNDVHFNGVTFFDEIRHSLFTGNSPNAMVLGDGTGAAGYSVGLIDDTFLPGTNNGGNYGILMSNLGYLYATNIEMSPGFYALGGFVVTSISSSPGGMNIVNSVLEASTTHPSMSLDLPATGVGDLFYFSNVDFGGGSSGAAFPAVVLGNVSYSQFTNGIITGNGNGILLKNATNHVDISTVNFQTGQSPIVAAAGATIGDIYVTDPIYGGVSRFFDYTASGVTTNGPIVVSGGSIGTSANPVSGPSTTYGSSTLTHDTLGDSIFNSTGTSIACFQQLQVNEICFAPNALNFTGPQTLSFPQYANMTTNASTGIGLYNATAGGNFESFNLGTPASFTLKALVAMDGSFRPGNSIYGPTSATINGDVAANGLAIANDSGTANVLNLTNAGTNAYIRNLGGILQILNSTFTTTTMSVDQSGNAQLAGNVKSAGTIISGSSTASGSFNPGDLLASESASCGALKLGGSTASAYLDFGCNSAGNFSFGGSANVKSNASIQAGTTLGINAGAQSWNAAGGAPSGACSSGSLYTNTTASAANTTLYACRSSAWQAITGG